VASCAIIGKPNFYWLLDAGELLYSKFYRCEKNIILEEHTPKHDPSIPPQYILVERTASSINGEPSVCGPPLESQKVIL